LTFLKLKGKLKQMSSSTTDQIRDVVYDIVSRHLHLKKGALKPDMDASEDADIFLRIVTDIEQDLNIGALEGNWVFEEPTVEGLVEYFREILDERM